MSSTLSSFISNSVRASNTFGIYFSLLQMRGYPGVYFYEIGQFRAQGRAGLQIFRR